MKGLLRGGMILLLWAVFAQCRDAGVKTWSQQRVDRWFAASEWSTGLTMTPDESIERRLLAEQVEANPASWAEAFRFLTGNDLLALEPGTYPLSDDGTYATVTDYTTREEGIFEVHRKFIDIQYVAAGEEYIDLTPLGEAPVYTEPYDAERDIAFFDRETFTRRLADPARYFVFFPSDAHRPCMAVEQIAPVRKIVVKIPWKKISPDPVRRTELR